MKPDCAELLREIVYCLNRFEVAQWRAANGHGDESAAVEAYNELKAAQKAAMDFLNYDPRETEEPA